MRRACNKCGGTGVTVDTGLSLPCSICNSLGYVELDNVVLAHMTTSHDLDPDQLLVEAVGELDDVVIVGYDKDGGEYFAASKSSGADVHWLLHRAAIRLLNSVDKEP